jgi:hypothetical protein
MQAQPVRNRHFSQAGGVMLNDFNGTCHSRQFRQAIRRCILDQA